MEVGPFWPRRVGPDPSILSLLEEQVLAMVESATPLLGRSEVNRLRGLLARLDPSSHNSSSQDPSSQDPSSWALSSWGEKRPSLSSGCPALDQVLLGGGIRAGSLIEWLGDGPGSGVSLLPLAAVRAVQQNGGVVVIVDREGIDRRSNFYPPAAAAWGIDLEKVVVVHPVNDSDELWAIDQALRCTDVAAVMAWPNRIGSHTFRRWQLAAESSGAVGLFVRPAREQGEPTWANLRLLVSPPAAGLSPPAAALSSSVAAAAAAAALGRRPSLEKLVASPGKLVAGWRWRVKVLRCRGVLGDWEVEVEVDQCTGEIHETSFGNLASGLATATLGEQTA